jgi:hypothetical protein
MKYKVGTLLSLDFNRQMFDTNGKVHSCKSGDLFLIIDKDDYDTGYTIVSVNGFYCNYLRNVVETTFQVIDV